MASLTSGERSPELPMHVMQPYPAVVKPNLSNSSDRPDLLRYSVTTPDPGDKLVLMNDLMLMPFSLAFLATKPAAIMESGLEVLVQEVMAAKTTEPCCNVCSSSLSLNLCFMFTLSAATPKPLKPTLLGTQSVKSLFTSERAILSCGLLGPEMQG